MVSGCTQGLWSKITGVRTQSSSLTSPLTLGKYVACLGSLYSLPDYSIWVPVLQGGVGEMK